MAEQHGRSEPSVRFGVLADLHDAIKGDEATVAVDESDRVVAIWPGYVDTAFGVAVDIGSTTIAGHLCDLTSGEVLASAGRMNPQIRFGEDLMSRVSYVMMNPGGDRELTEAVRLALDELVGELLERAGHTRDRVLEVVLVGNPIMHHIVLGIDPTPLGQAPFTLATNRAGRHAGGRPRPGAAQRPCLRRTVHRRPRGRRHGGGDPVRGTAPIRAHAAARRRRHQRRDRAR